MIRLLAANETMQWIVYAVGALTIVFVVLRPSLRKKDPLNQSGPKLSMAQQRSVEREMSNLLVELSEMARQITGQLDTRAAKLEVLMQEADKKIAELKRLETLHHEPEIKPLEARSAPLPADARYSAIYSLADAGHSVQEIAQQLDRPRGEVELILALRVPSESRS
ncbi:MAG TPA: hypothetical protein VGP99_06195 [Tepidisphaeraceae bacterium]|jgi:hypothetical protein|nr:hypothetical protein [Tepidisphaeraceae bacterium]